MKLRVSTEGKILVVICSADMLLTAFAVSIGIAKEQNPLMAACINHSMLTFIVIKTLSFVPFVVLTEWYRRKNLQFAQAASRCAIVLYLAAYTLLTLKANIG